MVCSRRASARRQPFSQFGKVPNLLLIFQVCLCHVALLSTALHATVRQALSYHAGPPWPSAIWLKHVLATCHAFGLNPNKGWGSTCKIWKRIRTVGFNKFDLVLLTFLNIYSIQLVVSLCRFTGLNTAALKESMEAGSIIMSPDSHVMPSSQFQHCPFIYCKDLLRCF